LPVEAVVVVQTEVEVVELVDTAQLFLENPLVEVPLLRVLLQFLVESTT
jgi:hypothetical protein